MTSQAAVLILAEEFLRVPGHNAVLVNSLLEALRERGQLSQAQTW